MTTDSVPAAGDPRGLLSDVRALAQRVRLDQRVTWVALLVVAAVTLVAIPIDWLGLRADCAAAVDGACRIRRLNIASYWLPALLVAYTAIAAYAVRVTRARGVGARVLPYVLTGVALALLYDRRVAGGDHLLEQPRAAHRTAARLGDGAGPPDRTVGARSGWRCWCWPGSSATSRCWCSPSAI